MANSYFSEFVNPFQRGSFVIRAEHYMRYQFVSELFVKKLKSDSVIYDIGCGDGYGSEKLRKSGFQVYGFDRSQELLRRTKKATTTHYSLIDLDKNNLADFVRKQDIQRPEAVICFEILEHLDSPASLLKHCSELLPKNGLLILSVPNQQFEPKKNGKSKNTFHKHLFDKEKIINLVETNDFTVSHVLGQPKANRFYHRMRKYMKFIDAVTNVSFPLFTLTARLIATPTEKNVENSYSFILLARKI